MSLSEGVTRRLIPQNPVDRLLVKMIMWQRLPVIGRYVSMLLCFRGTEIPTEVMTGEPPLLMHGGAGVVIHPRARLGNRVIVLQGVTIGRADPWREDSCNSDSAVVVEDDVFLGANAVVLFKPGVPLTVARGSVVGANSTLTCSTGPWEIWAGTPARKVGMRSPEDVSEGYVPSRRR